MKRVKATENHLWGAITVAAGRADDQKSIAGLQDQDTTKSTKFDQH